MISNRLQGIIGTEVQPRIKKINKTSVKMAFECAGKLFNANVRYRHCISKHLKMKPLKVEYTCSGNLCLVFSSLADFLYVTCDIFIYIRDGDLQDLATFLFSKEGLKTLKGCDRNHTVLEKCI